MKNKPFHIKKRNRYFLELVFLFIFTNIYVFAFSKVDGYEETIKYFYILFPLYFIFPFVALLEDKFFNVQKGISGENKVETLLKKYDIHYIRNYSLKNTNFDYDFIFERNNKYYTIEVKNYEKISIPKLNDTVKWSRINAAKLKEEKHYDWVEPLVVSVGALPENFKDENVFSLETIEGFLKRISIGESQK